MSCSCGTCTSCLSTETITIPNGAAGANGSNGFFGGFSAEWVFDTATSANPPLTELRFDNATLASVTNIYVNDTNADSVDHNNFLEQFKNSISGTDYFGLVRVWKQYDSDVFWMGKVTAVTDNGADHTIAVTHIASNGTFADTDDVVMSFTPAGSNGTNGTNGSAGSEVVDVDWVGSIAASTAGPTVLGTVTVPAGLLDTDKDYLEFSAYYITDDTDNTGDMLYLSIGDQGRALDSGERFATWREFGTKGCLLRGKVIRESSVLAHCITEAVFSYTANGVNISLSPDASKARINHQQIAIDWSQANIFELGHDSGTTQDTLTLQHLEVKHVQKSA